MVNAGVDPLYRLARLGDGVGHVLVRAESTPVSNAYDVAKAVSFVENALRNPREKQPPMTLQPVAAEAAARGDALGVVLVGKVVALDHDGVRHIHKEHGQPSERLRGQEPISADDLALFGSIFNRGSFALGDPPLAKDGSKLLSGATSIGAWQFWFVAKVRRRDVVPYTLFKRPRK